MDQCFIIRRYGEPLQGSNDRQPFSVAVFIRGSDIAILSYVVTNPVHGGEFVRMQPGIVSRVFVITINATIAYPRSSTEVGDDNQAKEETGRISFIDGLNDV